jgi:ubiquinone/menaquinone biosynthesis C-methylase UbiE
MSEINPMYSEGGPIESEKKRMRELEWPNEASSDVIPRELSGMTFGDIGAGPNQELGRIVKDRGGKYVAIDRNLGMTRAQREGDEEKNVAQADIFHLPFAEKSFDLLHTRFVIMNLSAGQRKTAIQELARVGKKNIVMDYNWKSFSSENPDVQSFIANGRRLGEIAGSDLDSGAKLSSLVREAVPNAEVSEIVINKGKIKDYKTLANLAESLMGLGLKIKSMTHDESEIRELEGLIEEMKRSEEAFRDIDGREDKSGVPPFTPPDIVAVTF